MALADGLGTANACPFAVRSFLCLRRKGALARREPETSPSKQVSTAVVMASRTAPSIVKREIPSIAFEF